MRPPRSFDELPLTPETHFRLHVYGAVLRLRARLPAPDGENGLGFLLGYYGELDAAGFAAAGPLADTRWHALIAGWEARVTAHLPLRALREACGLDDLALTLLFTVGLVEEDLRFGPLFEALGGLAGELRPTIGLLSSWSSDDQARTALSTLLQVGLVTASDTDGPRPQQGLQVPAVLWDAMRGATPRVPWARYQAPRELPEADALILSDQSRHALGRLPSVITTMQSRALIVRGPRSSGRRGVLGATARALGCGLLEVENQSTALVGPLSTLLNAMPVIELDLAPGEAYALVTWDGYRGPLGVIAGRRGGIRAPESAITLEIGMPGIGSRIRMWKAELGGDGDAAADVAARFRTPCGTIKTAAALARIEAALAGRTRPAAEDLRRAMHALHGEALEALARRISVRGDWGELAVAMETQRELDMLESRCRLRERLAENVGPALSSQLTPGVRALLTGPSGTGKSLAARLLAAVLDKELYALDLSAVVNKYLGETEKNLDAVLTRAEELDVILLLDEGDALLTRRTDVQTSNDRYANLETNFLLQRLDSYEGIILITTNAEDRIDPAFKRRMDVVVEFRGPTPLERWQIWQLHLPVEHDVPEDFLEELAARCVLSGGQIRNAALHASLLALGDCVTVSERQLDLAVRREYRKAGLVCPLRAPEAIGA